MFKDEDTEYIVLVLDNKIYEKLEYGEDMEEEYIEDESFSEYLKRNLKEYGDPVDGLIDMARKSYVKNEILFEDATLGIEFPREEFEKLMKTYLPKGEFGYLVSDFLKYIYFEYMREYRTPEFKKAMNEYGVSYKVIETYM